MGVDCQGLDCLDPDTGMCVNVMVGVNTTCDESGMVSIHCHLLSLTETIEFKISTQSQGR